MKKRFLLIGMTSLIMCISLLAHEFWIQPSRTRVRVGDRVSLYTMVGENFCGEHWQGKGNRVNGYKHFHKEDVHDLLLSIEPGEAIVDLPDFIPTKEGTHMLSFSTSNSFIEVEPEKFEAYLMADGLTKAFEYRNANNEKTKNGRELYRRCAKLLIQAGVETDWTYKKKVGLILEIIPERNPYDYQEEGLTFKILYEDQPLQNAMVRCWHKEGDKIETKYGLSSAKGEVTFDINEPGLFMLSLVHMIRLHNDPGADWQSTWSSLVFGSDY